MKVVLVNPRFGRPGREKGVTSAVFPYGLAVVAQALQAAGHRVEVFDPYIRELPPDRAAAALAGLRADWIGITAMSVQYAQVKWLVERIRRVHAGPIVLGGLLATHSWRTVLTHLPVDVCVLGDGVATAPRLLATPRQRWAEVPGIAYRDDDGGLRETGPGEGVADIDALGSPPYDLFDMTRYCRGRLWVRDPSIKERRRGGRGGPQRVMTVLTAWGCPYRCRFCSRSTDRVRVKSIPALVREIAHLQRAYDVEGIHFVDELAFLSKSRGMELAAAMKPLGLAWDAQARVDVVDAELCRAVRAAGCTAIGLGVESGSDAILRAMNKTGVTREKSLQAVRAARAAGLLVRIQLIMGYPGETAATVAETVDLFRRLGHPGRRFAMILPLPGSALYEECRRGGRIPDEADYLERIAAGYGGNGYFMNFMDMPRDRVLALKRRAEAAMERNYRRHLLATLQWRELYRFLRSKGTLPW